MTQDDPNKIADDLIQQYGLDDAIKVAMESAAAAIDNYVLSVWREVKVILLDKRPDPKAR